MKNNEFVTVHVTEIWCFWNFSNVLLVVIGYKWLAWKSKITLNYKGKSKLIMKRQSSNHHFQVSLSLAIAAVVLGTNWNLIVCPPLELFSASPHNLSSLSHYYAATFIGCLMWLVLSSSKVNHFSKFTPEPKEFKRIDCGLELSTILPILAHLYSILIAHLCTFSCLFSAFWVQFSFIMVHFSISFLSPLFNEQDLICVLPLFPLHCIAHVILALTVTFVIHYC